MTHPIDTARPVSAAELRDLADFLPDPAASHLLALAERQARAEAQAQAVQARKLIALIEGLAEYDQVVDSHLLVGMLRVAAGQKLLSVEQTALRIAGLAQIDESSLQITSEGKALLDLIASPFAETGTAKPVPAAADDTADAPKAAPAEHQPFVADPFASVTFGQRRFEVADGEHPGSLMFRLSGHEDWTPLDADRSCGWDEIGGEILEKGLDMIPEYIMMHTMRLAMPELGDGIHKFELMPLNWWLRVSKDSALFRAEGSDEWVQVPADIKEPHIRALGIRAAERLIPDFHKLLEAEAISWSRRMAHAAAVTPILANAA